MTNDEEEQEQERDVRAYLKRSAWSAAIMLVINLIALMIAWLVDNASLQLFLAGLFCGIALSSINLLMLGLAYFRLAIKHTSKAAILWPLASFLVMCVGAFIFAFYFKAMILGFALGLTGPVFIGAVIIFFQSKPA